MSKKARAILEGLEAGATPTMKTKRSKISKKKRYSIFERDGFKCRYCGRSVPDVVLHLDHFVPVSMNGSNDGDNLVTACEDCNLGKSNRRTPTSINGVSLSAHESAAFILGYAIATDFHGTQYKHWANLLETLEAACKVQECHATEADIERVLTIADYCMSLWVSLRAGYDSQRPMCQNNKQDTIEYHI